MGARRPDYSSSSDFDVRNCRSWQKQQQYEIVELIARTKETLAASRLLIEEADRILALR
jgi:hypothetical protein